jgi:hypothetical protein
MKGAVCDINGSSFSCRRFRMKESGLSDANDGIACHPCAHSKINIIAKEWEILVKATNLFKEIATYQCTCCTNGQNWNGAISVVLSLIAFISL